MANIPEKTIAELKAQHGEVLVLTSPEVNGERVQCAFKRPGRREYRAWKTAAADDRRKSLALEELAGNCLVFPSREDYERILDAQPALGDSFGVSLLEACGAGASDAKKV